MKNTGKRSEALFEEHVRRLGKRAFLFRFPDAAEIKGRVGSIGQVRAMPSDYLLVLDGKTEFIEVKSTNEQTRFPFSLLRRNQSADARRVTTAGGDYILLIHALPRNEWFKVPYSILNAEERSSIPWDSLAQWRYHLV